MVRIFKPTQDDHEEGIHHAVMEEVTVAELKRACANGVVVADWEALWCRKCKYLRPKLAKLAKTMPALRFVSIDVNAAPYAEVTAAGISKMPTIQLWRDGQVVGEIIGASETAMVIEQVEKLIRENTDIHERHMVDVDAIPLDTRGQI